MTIDPEREGHGMRVDGVVVEDARRLVVVRFELGSESLVLRLYPDLATQLAKRLVHRVELLEKGITSL